MIEIVHDRLTWDLPYEYSASLNHIGIRLRTLPANNCPGLASPFPFQITRAEPLPKQMYQADKGN